MGCVIADLYMEDCAVGVDILVGSDHYWDFVTGKIRKLDRKLRAVETSLGWTLQGPMEISSTVVQFSQVVALNATTAESTTSEVLQKFWDLETMGVTKMLRTEADTVSQRFQETIRKNNQRYEVSLPWKDAANLGDNRRIAEKRLQLLTKRLIRNADLMREYDATIQTYTITDIAEPAVSEQAGKRLYYMPHQAVHRESSTTTKLRVVFDASSHNSSSKSLNDCLKSGPNLNRDIVGLLLNFRRHRVALVTDIEKAFLQINTAAEDRDALRFLWYETTPEVGKPLPPIIEWRMTRVPFGTTSSPFLLAATLRHHLEAMASEYPETAPLLLDSLYVDDILTGAANETEGLKIYTEATEIFQQASLKLHKWASNSSNLLQQICANQESDKPLGQIAGLLKVLGLNLQPNEDILTFSLGDVVKFLERNTDTKRFVLQTTARLYDPLGFIAPFVVRAKILFQRIWQLKLDWDDPLPWELLAQWHKWCEELAPLCDVMVPRVYWQGMKGTPIRKVLHVFADASTLAYGAVAFQTTLSDCEDTVSTIVLCKSRVAPLREVSLARLELLACLIATRLSNYIQTELHEEIQEVHLWTDSKIALCWILGDACRWKPFVSNRVAEIQNKSEPANWRHCPGKENPADLVTRGISAAELLESETWWCGPSWLPHRSMWPQQSGPQDVTGESPEEEKETTLTNISSTTVTPEIKRFSSALRLLRTTAWILRFISKTRRTSADSGPLTREELNRADMLLIEQVQRVAFAEELQSIRKGKTLPAGSTLRTVPLLIDNNGLLRVAGRLQFSGKPYDEQHPVVLPKDHPFSSLLVNQAHRRLLHAGVRDTLVQLRERFWILRARQLVKKEIGKCIPCRRLNARPLTEVTAPLPSDRVREADAFEIVGINFAGPLWVSEKTSTKKAYVALFTCAVTRAIHLELVPDLTTKAFLRALRRFTSRRGLPRVVYSDNALTFKRANKEMKELWNMLRSEELKDHFSNNRIHWKFIAERAPWWGGFYERLVRSVKTSLKKAIGGRLLIEEELGTLLSEIEAVINSRPLTFTYNESQEPQPLSPSCFLVGKRLTSLPNPTAPDLKDVEAETLRKLWKHRQEVMKSFWQRWSKEYLTELGSLHCTKQSRQQIKVGDLVLLRESMQPRQLCKTGIVQQVFPGRDGKVRSCEVRLPNGTTVKRPVQLVYCLESSGCEKTD